MLPVRESTATGPYRFSQATCRRCLRCNNVWDQRRRWRWSPFEESSAGENFGESTRGSWAVLVPGPRSTANAPHDLSIARAIDLSHPAFAQLGDNVVRTEASSRGECHRVRKMWRLYLMRELPFFGASQTPVPALNVRVSVSWGSIPCRKVLAA